MGVVYFPQQANAKTIIPVDILELDMNYPTDDLSSEDEYWIDTGKSIDDLEVETLAELAALRAEIECSVKETKTDIKRVYWYKQDMWDRVLSK
jgi:hypothetical protein